MNDLSNYGMPAARGIGRESSVLALLERMDRRLATIEQTASRAEALGPTLPAAIGAATDTFDDVAERLAAKGVDIDERLRVLLDVAERLTSPDALRAVTTLLDRLPLLQHVIESGILDEPSVDVVGKAGAALAAAREEGTREVGLWGAARAMSDADVRRAVGFLLRVAQLFGRALEDNRSTLQLTEST
jgi:hypothetical protein